MKDKNLAKQDYLEMIKKSWTWAKLTEQEKEIFLNVLDHPCSSIIIKGNYKQRWEACEALYHTFLEGLEYMPLDWRETPSTKTTFYELNYKTYGQQVKPLQMTDKLQAIRLTKAAKSDQRNKDVKLTKVDLITTEMRID